MILLTLEAAALLIITYTSLSAPLTLRFSPHIIILILTMAATEARMGFSLLVLMARNYGNDIISNLSDLKC